MVQHEPFVYALARNMLRMLRVHYLPHLRRDVIALDF